MSKISYRDPLWQWRFVRRKNDKEGSLDLSIHERVTGDSFLEVFSDLKTGAGSKDLLAVVTTFLGTLLNIEASGFQSVRGILVASGNLEALVLASIQAELAVAEHKLTLPRE